MEKPTQIWTDGYSSKIYLIKLKFKINEQTSLEGMFWIKQLTYDVILFFVKIISHNLEI